MRRKRKNCLDLEIRCQSKGLYQIVIDGDKFHAGSYHEAICVVLEILVHDELQLPFIKSKIFDNYSKLHFEK